MLSQLYIRNVAVISEATIDFSNGLNVFTGETGAGKSILINAINAVLGERASKDLIRTGETRAVISALFIGLNEAAMADLCGAGYPVEDDTALIYREISADGKSVCKINGRPATVSILRGIASLLINVHGQHDNQQLLSAQKHLSFIDGYGELEALADSYGDAYRAYMRTKSELDQISTDDADKERRMDLLRYQIQEIEEADLCPGEEEELKGQRRLIQNAMQVTQSLAGSVALLDGDEESMGIVSMLDQAVRGITKAADYMEQARETGERLTDLYYELEAMAGDVRGLLDGFDCDPARLDEIESRLDVIYNLKRKYGPDEEAVLRFYETASEELEKIETSGARREKLQALVESQREQAQTLAAELSEKRRAAAEGFVRAVGEELVFLDMPSVRLSVRQEQKPLSPDGMDALELMIAANVGEAEKSLSKVASGGELSRIMLSIKNVMAHRDGVQTMIFDEVDTGVSGRAAQKIGKKLSQVAQNRQVIVVTHLAQVASYANRHLLIAKEARGERTYTSIRPLEREERVRELARITGGENISKLALEHAEEMLRDAGN